MSFRKNIAKDLSMKFRARADLGSTFERHSEQWRSECRNIPVTLRMAELIVGSYEIDWATAEGIDSAANTMNTSAQKVKEALHIARKAPNMLTMHPVSVHSYRIKRTVLACVLCLT